MNQFRNLIRSKGLLQFKPTPNQGSLQFLLPHSPKHFSTQIPDEQNQEQPEVTPIDAFLRPPNQGLVYGRLSGGGRFSMKTDILNLLEGCDLTPQNIRFEYNRMFAPVGMVVQFPSRAAFDNAVRAINRKGRLYKLDKADRSHWEIEYFDGKFVLLQGLPRNALPDDVERFLSGCNFNASNMQLLMRPGMPNPIRFGIVQFPSQVEATNAVLVKNRNFCLNNQVTMRVLH